MAADEALLDGGELRLVILNVDVDVLQLSDPLAVAIDQHLAVPLGDVPIGILPVFVHCRSRLVFPRCLAVTILGPASTHPTAPRLVTQARCEASGRLLRMLALKPGERLRQ